MQRYNITTKRTYQKDGEEKAQWNQVGTLAEFPAERDKEKGFAMELNMFPGTKFYVFEQKPKNEQPNIEAQYNGM